MLLERYEVGERLAESERNTVRKVRRLSDGARLIVKTSTRDYPSVREVQRLEFEYHILSKVRSPGVIAAVDIERQSGRVALILEDFGGERLSELVAKGIALSEFFPLASGVVRALGQVHAQNVMHKDINPGNILFNRATGEPKLIDFSIASELKREQLDAAPIHTLEGTLPYLSPEQTGRMNRDLDYRTDYYSLGVTFFELLTGSLPFNAPDVLGYIHCHLSKPVPNPRDINPRIPEGLARLLIKLMAKNPDDRYQSARGLLADLEHCERCWTKTSDVPSFELGQKDVSERFVVSQTLLGREVEAARLLGVFERAAQGQAELLLVAGYSGIGKSTLVSEIHRPVVEKRAHFVSGKFEQLERNMPYGAVLRALGGLLRQLLAEPERQLRARRDAILAALGNEAGVLVALLPELGQILGLQPPVAELPAREAQMRLFRLFRGFLRALATREHPLVIFLDDLQWADGSTPQLLLHLLGEGELRHVCVIAAYRNNEVGAQHLVRTAIEDLKAKRPQIVHELALGPLSEPVVEQMVAATLHAEPSACRPFAQLLFQKTGGNPFFVHELLSLLHRQGAIQFSAERGAWTWRDDAIARANISDNVVDLLLARLRELPADTLEALRIAACLGKEFDLDTVARVAGKSPGAIAAALWHAVEQRLLLPKGDEYRLLRSEHSQDDARAANTTGQGIAYQFPHDRVVESAYCLLSEAERSAYHAKIGRLLCEDVPAGERAERVFDFIDHLNRGRQLLESQDERAALVEHNFAAAEKARRSAAYRAAISYLEIAEGLLTHREWANRRDREFACARMRVECLFLSGEIERAQAACEDLFELAPSPVTRAAAFCLKAAIQEQRSQLAETVETIRIGLGELGIALPKEQAEIEQGIGAGIGKMQAHLGRVPIEDLVKLPSATDPLRVAATELLFQIIPAASQLNPPLFILAELELFDMALTHGTVPGSAKNVMDCGIVFSAILGDYGRAYRMGRTAYRLLERILPTTLESSVNFVFGCFISHWGAHFQEGLDALARGHQRGVELGDTLHASYSIVHRAKSLLFGGRNLGECVTQTDRALAYTQATGAVGHAALPRMLHRALGQLSGAHADSEDVRMSDADFIAEIEKTQNGHFLLVLGQTQTLVQLVLGDLARAEEWDRFATKYLAVGNGAFPVPDYYLFQSLILGRKWGSSNAEERASILATLERHHAALEVYAKASPANYAHKFLLVGAERARLSGASIDEVLRLHREAVAASGDDFVHLRALSQELLADFWKEKGHPEFARECLLEAYHLYRHWGASLKLERLEREHGKWLNPATPRQQGLTQGTLATTTATQSVESTNLDVASALKATLAISSEVKPARLFAVLMQTLIENVGAEHGFLVVRGTEEDELFVAAKASVGESEAQGALRIPLESCKEIARDLVRYVARTGETLVLDDARTDPTYKSDAHVSEHGVKSALCMPILSQGRLLAILYVENNAVTRAFTAARLLFLRVIAGQAAVSIANAELYDKLELKVAERTRELSERSREISAMLNSLEQGVFTIDDQLTIQPRFSAHLPELLGTREIAGQNCVDLLFRDTALDTETLDKLRAALEFSFGVPILFADANKGHWIREFQRTLGQSTRAFEIDWTLIADDDDNVYRMLVALRDVTVLRQISANAAQHARDLDFVGQILDAGVDHFQRFCASTREVLLEAQRLLEADLQGTTPTRQRIFRGLHTVKGNARLLGFQHLSNTVHRAEECFDARPIETQNRIRHAQMLEAVGSVLLGIDEYEAVYRTKLADVLGEPDRQEQVTFDAIRRRLSDAQTGLIGPNEALADIEDLLSRVGALSLAQIVQHSSRALPVLAQELGKSAPLVETEDGGVWLSPKWAETLRDSFVHAFQNALDHGIETADERLAKHKPAQGKISLRAVRTPRGTTLWLADDGRGLNLQALRAKGGRPDESDELAANRIFDSGVSTAARVTNVSGRGVGLDAVRSFVRKLGGEVTIVLGGPAENGFRPFQLVIDLPPDAIVGDPSRPSRPPPPGQTSYGSASSFPEPAQARSADGK